MYAIGIMTCVFLTVNGSAFVDWLLLCDVRLINVIGHELKRFIY